MANNKQKCNNPRKTPKKNATPASGTQFPFGQLVALSNVKLPSKDIIGQMADLKAQEELFKTATQVAGEYVASQMQASKPALSHQDTQANIVERMQAPIQQTKPAKKTSTPVPKNQVANQAKATVTQQRDEIKCAVLMPVG